MCGINGILTNKNHLKRKISLLNELLHHRGPDDEGFVLINTSSNSFKEFSGLASVVSIKQNLPQISEANYDNFDLILGHRRLSIIDLSEGGHGPMCDQSEKYWITYNGEIYNYLELRDDLMKLGHVFRTKSDTEVVINAYKQWGANCLMHFNGMWAFALWDGFNETLFLSRDRFGVKPLYYISLPGLFAFSSEIKPLALLLEKLEVNNEMISFFVLYGNRLNTKNTYINGIYSLEPSTYLMISDNKIKSHKYYVIKKNNFSDLTETQLSKRLEELLTDSIRLRFRSDVPVGTCLSGGFDSSTIVAVSTEMKKDNLKTFSAVWGNNSCDESKYIDIVNEKYSCIPFKIEPKAEEFENIFDKLNYYQEIPSEGPGLYPQWFVMSRAKGNVKVLLNGQGGDEVFGGYFATSAFLVSMIKDGNLIGILKNLKKFRHFFSKNGIHSFSNWMFPVMYSNLLRNFSKKKYGILNKGTIAEIERKKLIYDSEPPEKFDSYLNNLSYHYVTQLTIPTLLHYEDRSSMAFSIESRVPFLDYRIVEFGLNLEPNYLINRNVSRYLFRKTFEKKLPGEIVSRTDKLGYPVPFGEWTRSTLKNYVIETLLKNNSHISCFLNKKQLAKNLDYHFSLNMDFSWDIWRLLSLEKIISIYASLSRK